MGNSTIKAKLIIDAEISKAEQSIATLSERINSMWKSGGVPKSYLSSLEDMKTRMASMRQLAEKGYVNEEQLKAAQKEYRNFNKEINDTILSLKLMSETQKKGMFDKQTAQTISSAGSALKKYRTVAEKNKQISDEMATVNKNLSKAVRSRTAQEKNLGKELSENAKKVQKYLELEEELKRTQKTINTETNKGKNPNAKKGNDLTRAIEHKGDVEKQQADLGLSAEDIKTGRAELEQHQKAVQSAKEKIEKFNTTISELNKKIGSLKAQKTTQSLDDLKETLKELGIEGVDTAQSFEDIEKAVADFEQKALDGVQADIDGVIQSFKNLSTESDTLDTKMQETTKDIEAQNAAFANQKDILNRIKSFLGLQGAAQLMRSAINNSIKTVQELDAVMTEMAVVTDLGVGDYWNQLPEYTARANELGTAIGDVYKASTLYYQQGLKTNEVVALSNETIKMARISGLDTAEATDRMTAALRGFNMELNETNAQKVADVYSELAAITASDVDEISSAMTKTASIAASAGMEFETTAAFLSQIIETTRESAETAGTALKTVIARFQELKKDPSEIGEVDGEIVDANKIETALRSVGVALRDSSGQFRDLDDVFLELSSKWNSLDTNTQRYIATIAAGSRQQSRFIAMMQDYSRTQELVMAANDSAGASSEQFEKTMESLEAKLNQLKNAWDSFAMGILNSDIIKMGVDLLTQIITAINKMTEAFGPFDGAAKIALLTGALIVADQVLANFLKSFEPGQTILSAFVKGIKNTGASAVKAAKDIKKNWTKVRLEFALFSKGFKKTFKSTNKPFKNFLKDAKAVKKAAKIKMESGSVKKYSQAVKQSTAELRKEGALLTLKNTTLKKTQASENAAATSAITADAKQVASNLSLAASENIVGKAKDEVNDEEAQSIITKMLDIATTEIQGESAEDLARVKLQEYFATLLQSDATEEEIVAKGGAVLATLTETGATEALAVAETQEAATNTVSIGAIFGKIGALFASIPALISSTAATWGLVAAENAACPPLIAFTLIVLIVIAAIIALTVSVVILIAAVAVIIALFVAFISLLNKAGQNNSLDERAKQTSARLEELKEALSAAKDELDSLKSAQEEYNDLQNNLDVLTEGTQEWTQALLEANAQVMELVSLYPELAKYMQRNGGRLTIADEGWNELISAQQQKVNSLALSQSSASAELSMIEAEKKRNESYHASGGFDSSEFGNSVGNLVGAVTDLSGAITGTLAGGALIAGGAVLSGTGPGSAWGIPLMTAGAATIGMSTAGSGILDFIHGGTYEETMAKKDDQGVEGILANGFERLGKDFLIGFSGVGIPAALADMVNTGVSMAADIATLPLENLRKDQYEEFARKMNESGTTLEGSSQEEVAAIYKEVYGTEMTQQFYDNLKETGAQFDEFCSSLAQADAQMKAYTASLAQMAAEEAGVANTEWGQAAVDLVTSGYSTESMQALKNEKRDQVEAMSEEELMKQYASLMGYTYQDGKMYKTTDRTQLNSDNEIEVNKTAALDIVAEDLMKKEMSKDISNASNVLSMASVGKSKEEQAQMRRMVSGDVSKLTAQDVQNIKDAGGYEKYLKSIGLDTSELNLDFSDMDRTLNDIEDSSDETKSEVRTKLGMSEEDFAAADSIFEGLTANNAKALQTSLNKITETYGQEVGAKTLETMSGFLDASGFSSEQKAQISTYLANTDLSNADAVKGLSEAMVEMGVVSEEEAKKLDVFETSMIAAGMAVSSMNLEKIKQIGSTVNEMIEEIASGSKDITQEQYDMLKDAGVDMSGFAETAEGFRFLGTTGDLLEKTTQAANTSLIEMQKNYDAQFAATKNSLKVLADGSYAISETAEEGLTGWAAIGAWFEQLWGQIQQFFNWIGELLVGLWTSFLSLIDTLWGYFTDIFYKLWSQIGEGVENLFNGVIDGWNTVGELLHNLFKQIASWINNILPEEKKLNVGDYKKIGPVDLLSAEEIKANKARADANKKLVEDLNALSSSATETARAIQSMADSVSAGVLAMGKQNAEKKLTDLRAEYNTAIAKAGGEDKLDPQVKEAYEKAIADQESVVEAYDTALYSKGMKYDDLAPLVQKILYATEQGNEEDAEAFKRELVNSLAEKEILLPLTSNIESLVELRNEIALIGEDSVEAADLLEQMAYKMGFKDVAKGAALIRENFDDVALALNGDVEAWKRFQGAVAKSVGLGSGNIMGDLTMQARKNDETADKSLDTLLSSGGYKLVEKQATTNMTVANIDYSNGTAGINKDQATKNVRAGETYWAVEAADPDAIADLKEYTKFNTSQYGILFKLNQDINKELRERNKLEHDYVVMGHSAAQNTKEMAENRQKYFESLQAEANLLKSQEVGLYAEAKKTYSEGKDDWKDIVSYDETTGSYTVDNDKLAAATWITNAEDKEAFDNWIASMDENSSAIEENIDAQHENTEAQYEFIKEQKEQQMDTQDRLRDALVSAQEKEIEALQNLNDSITDAQDRLLSSIEESIDQNRQERENSEKEEEISDAESKLAYLMADTNGNSLEVQRLQEEIDDKKQEYEDSLVDQALDKLSQANEKAAEQRERQISIAEQSLEAYQSSGAIWADVHRIISESVEAVNNGGSFEDTSFWQAISKGENLSGESALGYESIMEAVATGFSYFLNDIPEVTDPEPEVTIDTSVNNNVSANAEATATGGSGEGTGTEGTGTEGTGTEGTGTTKEETPPPTTPRSSGGGGGGGAGKGAISVRFDDQAHVRFATGGLADFTGPAWLDGTKSRPELVLNQRDTANFIQLKDILAEVMNHSINSDTKAKTSGDNYFDIEINVESIDSDYDVEQIADKIRGMIYEDATYRNVNVINKIR